MRMLMNNLDPEVAEHPDQLIVYGGSGRAARSWPAFDAIVRSRTDLGDLVDGLVAAHEAQQRASPALDRVERQIHRDVHEVRLQRRVAAEGVERSDQLECLRTLGCDYLQGQLMAPAVAAAGIPKYLSSLTAPVARHIRR